MADAYPHLHVILLCEDYGAGLWPIARPSAPACLAPEAPGSKRTLLAAAASRVRALSEAPLHVVTTAELAPLLEDELLSSPELADCDCDMLVTPVERGSALAVALVVARIRKQDPAAVVAVFPSNQKVVLDDRWQHLMHRAFLAALQDQLVVVGTRQQEPCLGNTFVRPGTELASLQDTYKVRSFDIDASWPLARRAQWEGALWYTGIVFGRAAAVMGEFVRASELGRTQDALLANRIAEAATFFASLSAADLLKDEARAVVEAMPAMSFERAALETSGNLVVVSTTIPFSTVSDLASFEHHAAPDALGNRVIGAGAAVNSKNTTLYAQDASRRVVALGMQDCLIVDTGDIVLVADKGHLNEMDDVLRELGEEKTPKSVE